MKKVYLFLLLCVCIQLSWGQDRATEIRNTFLSGNTSLLLVVAHRADWRNAPENSLQGIQNCIDMGVDMVEIDRSELSPIMVSSWVRTSVAVST